MFAILLVTFNTVKILTLVWATLIIELAFDVMDNTLAAGIKIPVPWLAPNENDGVATVPLAMSMFATLANIETFIFPVDAFWATVKLPELVFCVTVKLPVEVFCETVKLLVELLPELIFWVTVKFPVLAFCVIVKLPVEVFWTTVALPVLVFQTTFKFEWRLAFAIRSVRFVTFNVPDILAFSVMVAFLETVKLENAVTFPPTSNVVAILPEPNTLALAPRPAAGPMVIFPVNVFDDTLRP